VREMRRGLYQDLLRYAQDLDLASQAAERGQLLTREPVMTFPCSELGLAQRSHSPSASSEMPSSWVTAAFVLPLVLTGKGLSPTHATGFQPPVVRRDWASAGGAARVPLARCLGGIVVSEGDNLP
jgi:hypothetical protein